MTDTETLQHLQARLAGGVATAISPRRPHRWTADDEHHIDHPAIAGSLRTLYRVTDDGGLSPATVEAGIAELATALRTARATLIAVLFSPSTLLERAPAMAGRRTATLVEHWMGLCWIAEAAWHAVDQGLHGNDYATGDDALLRPVAARLRFLSLSEPMRSRGHASAWLSNDDLAFYDHEHGLLGRAFGTGTWNGLVGRCADARRIWREHLDTYQDHFFLAGASPAGLEADLRRLVFRTEAGRGPLILSTDPLSRPAAPTAEDTLLIGSVTERHLLPRFDLRSVHRLAWYETGTWRANVRKVMGALVAASAVGVIVAALICSVRLAAAPACLAYALIIIGTIMFDQRWTAPWLLRLPATATVGLLVLVTLPHDWWTTRPADGNPAHWLDPAQVPWHVPVLLLLASYGYLIIEGRNHGLSPGMSLVRGLAVAGFGLLHGVLVATIGVVTILPAFGEAGTDFARLWTDSARHIHQAWILAFTATWCLAVGVFSQILWDDRPITAPLAHLSWRSER